MDISAILLEIDAELEKLQQIRAIVKALSGPAVVTVRKREPKPQIPDPPPAEPAVTVLPPKLKREYRARVKSVPSELRALGAAVPDKPVFVPQAAIAVKATATPREQAVDAERLEATIRRRLLQPSGLRHDRP